MRIEQYKSGDEIKIIELFKLVFGFEMSDAYWQWRYQLNPSLDSKMIRLMFNEDQLIGHYAVSPNWLDINGEKIMSALSMTTMTHPDFSGRGILTTLASMLYREEAKVKGLKFVFGFPNDQSHRLLIKHLAWHDISQIPQFQLDLSTFRFHSDEETGISHFSQFNEDHVNTARNIQSTFEIKPLKDSKFLNWRYIQHPDNDYICLTDPSTHAHVVAKRYNPRGETDSGQVDIVEWNVPDELELSNAFINELVNVFKDIELNLINMWLPLHDSRHIILEKLGFVNTIPITYFGAHSTDLKGLKSKDWYIQMGDSDIY